MNKKRNNQKYLLPIIILSLIMIIPSTWAMYYAGIESTMTTKFTIEYEAVFVRAHIITYWEDIESGEISAKSSWTVNSKIINNNWTKVEDYYYYNGTFQKDNISDGIPVGSELISPELTVEELSTDDLTDLKNIAKYQVIYEYIEAKATTDDKLSCEDAWNITYSESGIPSKLS